MEWLEAHDEKGQVVWKSPEVQELGIDRIENTIKALDLESSQVLGVHIVRPGEMIIRMPSGLTVSMS